MFFNGWSSLGRILLVGALAYVGLVLLLRLTGKRTLSKLNAFDLVITVALGSTLATILLSKDVALADGIVAFALLVGLQYGVAWLSVRSTRFGHLVKARPALLLYRGRLDERLMKAERVTRGEVEQAVRQEGGASLESVTAVVLETDGSLSVLQEAEPRGTALKDLQGMKRFDREPLDRDAGSLRHSRGGACATRGLFRMEACPW